jgi:hypothetical protein
MRDVHLSGLKYGALLTMAGGQSLEKSRQEVVADHRASSSMGGGGLVRMYPASCQV